MIDSVRSYPAPTAYNSYTNKLNLGKISSMPPEQEIGDDECVFLSLARTSSDPITATFWFIIYSQRDRSHRQWIDGNAQYNVEDKVMSLDDYEGL
ncbi:hypothetical protein DID80_01765 [Candidatus Marinamargulisbacteria bacterium SCGC AAA071-K20]|nr:hypothetical protein DID80_01765 [Candidatus Marinamargulisbacteria bacterium SCGC AAA071-K20]